MDDTLDDDFDEAIAVLYDETYDFLTNVETIMHITPEKKPRKKNLKK